MTKERGRVPTPDAQEVRPSTRVQIGGRQLSFLVSPGGDIQAG